MYYVMLLYYETFVIQHSYCVYLGSERVKETTSKSLKKVAVDHGVINKSIYVLGKVISGLVRNHGSIDHPDVPYKDSKLTKLLINSLGMHFAVHTLAVLIGITVVNILR